MNRYYAHSTKNTDKSDWQVLSEHLLNTAGRAREFAAVFGAGEWGFCAGLLHDTGKATSVFTRRLEGEPIRVDHATFGARLAQERTGRLGLLLSYAVAGHHGGLPDGGEQEQELHFRLKNGKIPVDVELLPEADFRKELVPPFKLSREMTGFRLAFFTRMVFSCLVDADFLDTEAFCDPEKAAYRPAAPPEDLFADLRASFDKHLEEKASQADPTPVNRLRQDILAQCREKACLPPGFFSLTVPTGGGKTFSSLAFALNHVIAHAHNHGFRRVIYAIPFTSIIEQNAQVFRKALGREHVLEHHCNYRGSDDPEDRAYNRRRGLASENWDAPVVVTTNVQFFESLFSNKPSRCRKLHNIAGSVIILDEAQAIPAEYLEPCMAALRELVDNYRCSAVLCTATQPALDDESCLRSALPRVEEIVKNPAQNFEELHRTAVSFIGQITDVDLAGRIERERQVLCIVATKPHARALYEQVSENEGLFHLSTNMYPLHRRRILEKVRGRLQEKKTCRVISTSLVEAGVDLDFPVVYRVMAGLDSIAQAAGRCNREGKMDVGQVFVFEPEKPPRVPLMKRCMTRAAETLRAFPHADPLGLEAMRRYFKLLYDVEDLDKKQIMKLLNTKLDKDLLWPFREVSRAFRFIEEDTSGVIVATEPEARMLVQELRYTESPRAMLRKLQQYTVGVRARDLAALDAAGALEMINDEFPVLRNEAAYKDDVGLCVDAGDVWEPKDLIS